MRSLARQIAILVLALGLAGHVAGAALVEAAIPAIAVSPTGGIPGSPVTVTGSGFSANETAITITYDGVIVTSGITASPQGSWSGSFIVPASASGFHSIGAYGSTTLPSFVTAVTFMVSPMITISRTSGSAGVTEAVSGSGFGAGESGITITYDGVAVVSGITASPQGSWTSSFVVPPSASGGHTITASGPVTTGMSATFNLVSGISISQASGAQGASITVTGVGFGANETGITVTYDSIAVVSGITASAQGGWTATFVVPASASGSHTIRAYGSMTTGTPSVGFSVTATVSTSRTTGSPGSSLTVSGSSFGASEAGISVTYDGTILATGVTASPQGSWSTSVVIPASPAGPHSIHAYGPVTAVSATSDVTFTVSAGISISQSSGTPGTSLSVSGSGFGPADSSITITYDGATVASGIRADASGSWISGFLVPASASGSHIIRAYSASATNVPGVGFTVRPTVSTSAAGGTPGSSLTVTGAGFGANETGVAITFDGVSVASGIRANATGSWNASFVVPASASGPHSVHAYGSATLIASTSDILFTVSAGISISQPSAVPGSSLTVAGAGFGANETGITVTYDGATVASGIRANATGSWSAPITVPASAAGSHALHSFGSVTTASSTSDVILTVVPGISINLASAAPGSTLTVTGTGFGAAETGITVTYDGASVASGIRLVLPQQELSQSNEVTNDSAMVASGIRADSQGSWNTSFLVPPSAAGPHSIRASGSVTRVSGPSEAILNVTSGISVNPDFGHVGSAVDVSGSGFAANSPPKISYDNQDVSSPALTTDATGSFTQSITVPKSKAGAHAIGVVDGQRNSARGTFTIDSTPPAVPVPLSPDDGARIGIFGNITPTFRWSNVTDPSGVSFNLEIDTYPDFAQPILVKTDISGSRYTLIVSEALPQGQYYWRVKAINGASVESGWSQTRLLSSGIPPWIPAVSLLAVVVLGAGIFLVLASQRARRRKALAVPALGMPQTVPGQLPAIEAGESAARRQLPGGRPSLPKTAGMLESGGESSGESRFPWRLALPEPSKETKTLSDQDQARLNIIIDFAQSLPLIEPGYDVNWLVNLVEAGTGTKVSPVVYERLLQGELQVRYEPAWMRHPVYQDLATLLEGQAVLQELSAFVDAVNQRALEATSLLLEIYRDIEAEVSTDFLEEGGWEFIAAVYSDAVSWFRGKSVHDPSERDYIIKPREGGEDGAAAIWLYGEEATSFAGPLARASNEEDALRLRSLHLKLRGVYRNSDEARQVTTMISQLEVQRSRLLSVFSQFGHLKQ